MSKRVESALDEFEDILGSGDDRSMRDVLAHWMHVPAGTFNLLFRPGEGVTIELTGGGEELAIGAVPVEDAPRLAPVLIERLHRFEDLIFELLAMLPMRGSASCG